MRSWTTVLWFRTLTVAVLVSFFSLYSVNLTMWVGIAKAHAQSVDDLLDEDDDDLLGDLPDEPEGKPAEVSKEKKKPAKVEDDDDDLDDEDDDLDDEDDEDLDDEDLDDEDDVVKAPVKEAPVKEVVPQRNKPVLGAMQKGAITVVPIIVPMAPRHKRRAVEVQLLTRAWLRSSSDYTHLSVNKALGDTSIENEAFLSKQAKKSLADGIAAYESNEFTDAVDFFEDAFAQFTPILEFDEYKTGYQKTLIYLAASYILDDEEDEGADVFTRLLRWNNRVTLSGFTFPGNVKSEFEKAKKNLATSPKAKIAVSSEPDNVPVFIDGLFRGLTPISVGNLSVDEHYVKLDAPAYKSYSMNLRLFKGVEKKLPATMHQIDKYYQYQGEISQITKKFQHRYMWQPVQNISETMEVDELYLCQVSEANGVVTLTAFFYNIEEETYKTMSSDIDLSSDDFETGVLLFMEDITSESLMAHDAYIPPDEKSSEVAAATPVYKTWWFWTIIGVVVAGGVGAGVYFGAFNDSNSDDNTNTKPDFQNPNAIQVSF